MFTGLIESLGSIISLTTINTGVKLTIESNLDSLLIGDSIAINGVCLTVTEIDGKNLSFDISPETLERSNLKYLTTNIKVHLETSLTLSKPMGGHFVTGHVDEMLFIHSVKSVGEYFQYVFSGVTHPSWICAKGSIALDGVSLTINSLIDDDKFDCMLIPHTISMTRFKDLQCNDLVNVEYDYLAKIVARQHALEEKK